MGSASGSKKERWIQHYKSSQQILLVGEGDLSFATCLAKAFCSADNMVATSLESEDRFRSKHWSSVANLDVLDARNCRVLFEIDVHDMNKCPELVDMKFDVIVFNFPHAGHVSWLRESDTILIERHKKLLRGFFRSARQLLAEGGEIHVTLRNDQPYCQWEAEELAETAGLVLKEKVPFVKECYPGYHNKRGSVIKGNKKFPIELPYTFKFCVNPGFKEIKPEISSSDAACTISTNDHKETELVMMIREIVSSFSTHDRNEVKLMALLNDAVSGISSHDLKEIKPEIVMSDVVSSISTLSVSEALVGDETMPLSMAESNDTDESFLAGGNHSLADNLKGNSDVVVDDNRVEKSQIGTCSTSVRSG